MWQTIQASDLPDSPLADTDEDVAAWLFGQAKQMFLNDGCHGSIAFLLKDQRIVAICGLSTQNLSRKRSAQRELAKLVVSTGADAVVSISEAWLGVTTEFTGAESTAEMPHRIEVLLLTLVSRNADAVMYSMPIHRNPSGLSLGDTIRQPLDAPIMFSAVYKAWGLEVPEAWDRDVKSVDGAAAVRVEGGTKAN